MHARYLRPLATIALTVGCTEPSTSERSQDVGVIGCEDFVCGNTGNSPEIDNRGLHELNLEYPHYRPEPRSGFRIAGFFKNGVEYIPRVEGATLVGLDIATGQVTLDGGNLIGSQLRVLNRTGSEYALQIFAVDSTKYWATPGGVQRTTPFYRIEWTVVTNGQVGRDWKNICSGPWPEYGIDTLNLDITAVVLFEGDRIDAPTKRVTGVDAKWFNIGCAGHAISKVHLSGHSQGAQNEHPDVFQTSLEDRTAFLKMMVADYCDTGKAFTIAGQPLGWIDDEQWMAYKQPPETIEARWSDRGATCLGSPRLFANPSPEGNDAFKDIKGAIDQACGEIPQCLGLPTELDSKHLVSANPAP